MIAMWTLKNLKRALKIVALVVTTPLVIIEKLEQA